MKTETILLAIDDYYFTCNINYWWEKHDPDYHNKNPKPFQEVELDEVTACFDVDENDIELSDPFLKKYKPRIDKELERFTGEDPAEFMPETEES
jgi:hypothetical protein